MITDKTINPASVDAALRQMNLRELVLIAGERGQVEQQDALQRIFDMRLESELQAEGVS